MKKTKYICISFVGVISILSGIIWFLQDMKEVPIPADRKKDAAVVIIQNEEPPVTPVIDELTPVKFVVVSEDGFLTVYHGDYRTLYAFTDITYDELEEAVKHKVDQGMTFETEEELYDFLENHSS